MTILGIYNADGLGNAITDPNHVGNLNPIRYRSYYYDAETGLYYLMSRYYDPQVKRFINADGMVSTGQGLLGYNMFAYANNNPVNMSDPGGNCAKASTWASQRGYGIISDMQRAYGTSDIDVIYHKATNSICATPIPVCNHTPFIGPKPNTTSKQTTVQTITQSSKVQNGGAVTLSVTTIVKQSAYDWEEISLERCSYDIEGGIIGVSGAYGNNRGMGNRTFFESHFPKQTFTSAWDPEPVGALIGITVNVVWGNGSKEEFQLNIGEGPSLGGRNSLGI